jgi:aminopeptidase N
MKLTSVLILFFISTVGFSQLHHTCKGNRHHHGSAQAKNSFDDNKRSDTVDILNYHIYLDFSLSGASTIFGYSDVTFNPKINGTDHLNLDLLEMTVDSVKQGLTNLTFGYNDTVLNVLLSAALNTTDTATITVYYGGTPQQDASGWGGFYFQGNYSYNLGVGFAADPHNYGRVWHPCFDNFKERATYQFDILTTFGKIAYCNGYISGETIIGVGDTVIRSWQIDEPIPSYLASVAVGNYTHARLDHISSVSGSNIPVWLISEPVDTSSFKNAFQNVDAALDAFEIGYGGHQWNKVGFVAVPFSSGAMEHPTNISYPRSVLGGGTSFETLMAHELSHHWWGDYVTTELESEMWINEGMATYSEHLFLEQTYGYSNYLAEVRANHKSVLTTAHLSDNGYYAIANVPHEFTYGDHSYMKGADVVHSLRSTMGDSNFFAGLKSIQTNRPHSTINSLQFRDDLNAASTVDVTDFFNDWVLNPGFPQFAVDSFSVVPNGAEFDVTVYTKQRLYAAPSYYNNVPIQVNFLDENWNSFDTTVVLSGLNDAVTITMSFNPTAAFLNADDKISQAVTGESSKFQVVTNVNLSYSDTRPYIDALTDSALIRTEHNFVAPDNFINPLGYNAQFTLSPAHYWSVHGIFGSNFSGRLRVFYRGQTPTSIDAPLFDDGGAGTFNEDSIRMFYRRGAGYEWTVMAGADVNSLGSTIDGYGQVTTDSLLPGDYTFGWISGPVGIDEPESRHMFRVYPNPTSETVWIDLLDQEISTYTIQLFNMNGQLIKSSKSSAALVNFDVSNVSSGTYILSILDGGKFIGSEQLIIH